MLIIDPQNDFLSEGGVVWDLVGEGVKENHVVEHLVQLKQTAKEIGIPVVYSPHYYSDEEFSSWSHLNPIDRLMFDRKMFRKGTWGAEFHPQLQPDENTIVLSPHKALSNFWSGDVQIQLRQRNIQTIILAGMSANLCVESHLRDAIEHGFDVLVVKDATTGPGKEATQAAYVNYGLIANEVVTTEKIIHRLEQAAEKQAAKPMA
ncbi:Isochorismatase [Methanosarcina sp. MTP4]|uniref:cysteine hydrolase family protein n=1 Tax=Methanosarcina sp. Mfa9 TaxID=3439063 RepID=UPI000615D6AE|nr:Isochorismatase [Methanosarcina sp. MTP4]